jgi:hypothetical protein
MNEIESAKISKRMRKKLKNGSFFNNNNKKFIDDLFDDTKILLEPYDNIKPRIGRKYQAHIPRN